MSQADLSSVRVLVVDDNMNMRRLIRTILIGFGVGRVIDASAGDQALAVLRDNDIDIVVTDLLMEPMDGCELIRAIRDRDRSRNPYVPIIMLTGAANTETIARARDAGVTEFLGKPMSAESLYRRLQVVIERPRPFIRSKVYFGPDRRRRRLDEYDGPERREDLARENKGMAS